MLRLICQILDWIQVSLNDIDSRQINVRGDDCFLCEENRFFYRF